MDISGDDSIAIMKIPERKICKPRSNVWNCFIDRDRVNKKAKCKYCETFISYKSTISNLKLHLQRKHNDAYKIFCTDISFSSIDDDTGNVLPENVLPIDQQIECDEEKIVSNESDRILPMKKRVREATAIVWKYFEKDLNENPMCNICKRKISCKSTVTNLKLHLMRKHIKEFKEYCKIVSSTYSTDDDTVNVKSKNVLPIVSGDEEEMDNDGDDGVLRKTAVKRAINSSIWKYFEDRDNVNKRAKCKYCETSISYKSTITNLKLHLERKHNEVFKEFCKTGYSTSSIECDTGNVNPKIVHVDIPNSGGEEEWLDSEGDDGVLLVPENATQINSQSAPLASFLVIPKLSEHLVLTSPIADIQTQPPINHQNLESSYTPRKLGLNEKAHIDKCLLNLIINDFQPFSIVENEGFKEYTHALNPDYVLPHRKTLSEQLTAEYKTVLQSTKQLVNDFCKSICLTAECWRSRNLVAYIAITGHFIHCETLEHRSVLLQCSALECYHTSAHIAKEIKKIIEEWGIKEKVNFFVAGNAPNMLSAANLLGWEHFGCYSHKLNLIVQEALNLPNISTILQKVHKIVAHFKRNLQAKENLIQNQINVQNVTAGCMKNLILNTPSQWISTFLMLQRFSEIQEALRYTIPNLTADLPMISMEEWKCIKQLVEVLEPLYEVTVIMNAEKYLVASKALVLSHGLKDIFERHLQRNIVYDSVKEVLTCLKNGLAKKFDKLEFNEAIGLCTYLDPRFKEHAFDNQDALAGIKLVLIAKIVALLNDDDYIVARENTIPDVNSVWMNFDSKIKSGKTSKSAATKAVEEIEMYLKEAVINRMACPLQWWRDHKDIYPSLYSLFIHHSNIVVTSVPCEREFSKAGYVLSDRRTRLTSSKVTQIMFLNANRTI